MGDHRYASQEDVSKMNRELGQSEFAMEYGETHAIDQNGRKVSHPTPHERAKAIHADMVTLPAHYARWDVEPIYFLIQNLGPKPLVFNAVKYLMRYDAKNGIEDLNKAIRYTEMLREYTKGNPHWWTADFKAPPPKVEAMVEKVTRTAWPQDEAFWHSAHPSEDKPSWGVDDGP